MISKIIVWTIKLSLFYYLGLVLGLGSFDVESSLINQNWGVYFFLYLPLAMGIEGFIITAIEAFQESKTDEEVGLPKMKNPPPPPLPRI